METVVEEPATAPIAAIPILTPALGNTIEVTNPAGKWNSLNIKYIIFNSFIHI